MSNIYPVILSGGSGTRLWPLSRSMYPKQFIRFFSGQNGSFLAAALARLKQTSGFRSADPSLQQRSPLPHSRGGRPRRHRSAGHRSRAGRAQHGPGDCRRSASGAQRRSQRDLGGHAIRSHRQGRNEFRRRREARRGSCRRRASSFSSASSRPNPIRATATSSRVPSFRASMARLSLSPPSPRSRPCNGRNLCRGRTFLE